MSKLTPFSEGVTHYILLWSCLMSNQGWVLLARRIASSLTGMMGKWVGGLSLCVAVPTVGSSVFMYGFLCVFCWWVVGFYFTENSRCPAFKNQCSWWAVVWLTQRLRADSVTVLCRGHCSFILFSVCPCWGCPHGENCPGPQNMK